MRRSPRLSLVLDLILFACAIPATAWPQSGPHSRQVVGPRGDAASVDSLRVPKPDTPSTPVGRGIPFGPFALFAGPSTLAFDPGPFSLTLNSVSPSALPKLIASARARNVKLILAMTGGGHRTYITAGKFDLGMWEARQRLFDTPANKAAVAVGVADGTVLAATLIDEPNHPSWGGVVTKALTDTMSRYTKAIFPTLPTAVVVTYSWQPEERWKDVDLMISQYSERKGDLASFRTGAVAAAKANGTALMFSVNVISWSKVPGCPVPQTGGPATDEARLCRATGPQFAAAGIALGLTPEACGLLMWQHDPTFFEKAENVMASTQIAAALATRPSVPCRRR